MMRRLLVLCAGVVLLVTAVRAQQSPRFRFERVVITDSPGPRRLPVDLSLLQHAAPFARLERITEREGAHWRAVDGLSDLRLFAESGREVPYLLVYPRASEPAWVEARSILPARVPRDKNTGFEADLGATAQVDSIHVAGIPAPFLKRLLLEGSGDRERWTVLAAEGTLFDLPQEALRQLTLPFTPGTYRYLRVIWNDANSGRVPLPRTVSARLSRSSAPVPDMPRVEAAFERRPSEPGRSRYRVKLPSGGLPVAALALEAGGGHIFRPATVTESALQGTSAAPREIGRATLSRVIREGTSAEDLRIPVSRPRDVQLELSVEDGSNPPLELTRVWLELAELPWIYFEAPPGRVVARYGAADVQAPRYDLEAARGAVRIADVADARWEPASGVTPGDANADETPRPQPGPAIDLQGYRFERTLSDATGLAVAPLDAAVLANSRGVDGGFADLRIVDAGNRQIPYLVERLQEPLALDLAAQRTESTARELTGGSGRAPSAYALRLPFAGLPSSSLVIDTSARLFTRGVRIGFERPADRRHRDAWFQELASARWTHTSGDAAASLSLRLPPTNAPQLLLVVDEGDNSPLPLTAVRLLLPAYRLRFYSPEGDARLIYGRPDQPAPEYDFELLAARILGADAAEVQLGEEQALGGSAAPEGRPTPVSQRMFWAGLGVAVVILAGLIVRLMRTREP
jgi:hypothetical protein